MSSGICCIVKGRVQGVFFRATTRRKATELGLHGCVSNLPDGSVEVIAWGEPRSLQALETWLWQGPPAAQVNEVQCTQLDREVHDCSGDIAF